MNIKFQIWFSGGGKKPFAMALLAILLMPSTSMAYIGPGAGLSAIGTVFALIGAVFFLIVGFVWYPFKRLLKRRSSHNESDGRDDVDENK